MKFLLNTCELWVAVARLESAIRERLSGCQLLVDNHFLFLIHSGGFALQK